MTTTPRQNADSDCTCTTPPADYVIRADEYGEPYPACPFCGEHLYL